MRNKLAGLGLFATVAIVGCGGGGGGSSTNPFTGSWDAQNATLTVASDGRYNMSVELDDSIETHQGRISGSGNVTGTVRTTLAPGVSFPVTGTASRNNSSEITLSLTATNPETGATSSTSAVLVKARGVVNRNVGTSPLAGITKKFRTQ